MANKLEYEIVGRYMDGTEVTGYHMKVSNEKSTRYTREQVCYLVGKGQVINCEGQLYQDKVLLRGKGISIESLPVISEKDGSLSRAENLGKVKKGTTAQDALNQVLIIKSITQGRNTVGYVVQGAGGVTKQLNRETVMEMAATGRIGNATVQKNNGQLLLRGVGCNLNELPTISIENKPSESQTVSEQAQNIDFKSKANLAAESFGKALRNKGFKVTTNEPIENSKTGALCYNMTIAGAGGALDLFLSILRTKPNYNISYFECVTGKEINIKCDDATTVLNTILKVINDEELA